MMSTKSIISIIIILSSVDHHYYQYRVQQILNDPQVKAQQARESNAVQEDYSFDDSYDSDSDDKHDNAEIKMIIIVIF